MVFDRAYICLEYTQERVNKTTDVEYGACDIKLDW